jgi:hypothetical protein
VNDSVRESVVAFDGMRSLTTGLGFGRLLTIAFPGGDLSGVKFGVGGLRWLVGVTGVTGGGSRMLSLLRSGLAIYVGLEGRAEWLEEEVRE